MDASWRAVITSDYQQAPGRMVAVAGSGQSIACACCRAVLLPGGSGRLQHDCRACLRIPQAPAKATGAGRRLEAAPPTAEPWPCAPCTCSLPHTSRVAGWRTRPRIPRQAAPCCCRLHVRPPPGSGPPGAAARPTTATGAPQQPTACHLIDPIRPTTHLNASTAGLGAATESVADPPSGAPGSTPHAAPLPDVPGAVRVCCSGV